MRISISASPPPSSSSSTPSSSSDSDAALFDSLASALALPCSSDGGALPAVTSGISPLTGARGLITVRGVRPGERLLAVDRSSALVVADGGIVDTSSTSSGASPSSSCFASQSLEEFQMLHGPFPGELERFLKSGTVDWFPRLCAFLLWVTAAEQGPAGGNGGGGGGSLSSSSSSSSSSSPFAAYSRLLPDPERDLGLLLNFDEREAGLLLPPELAAVAARERDSLRLAVHDRWFVEASSSSPPPSSPSSASSPSEFSLAPLGLTPRGFESTLAAAALVNSRCFAEVAPPIVGGSPPPLAAAAAADDDDGGRKQKQQRQQQQQQALSLVVPLCDLANHASAPSAAFRLSADEEGAFELVATRSLRPGEEVTISYLGGAGNASSLDAVLGSSSFSSSSSPSKDSTGMLRAYGFVVPGNPADRLPSLAEAGRALQEEARGGALSSPASSSSSSSSSSPSPPSPSPTLLLPLLSAAAAALASRSRDAAERRRIAAAAASIAEGAESVFVGGGAKTKEPPPPPFSSFSSLNSFAPRLEAEAEDAREAAGRALSLASSGEVSPARAEAAASWWLERAELARCGAELLRELASG